MHELSLARNLLDILEREGRERGFRRVLRIRLRIGPLSNVVPDALRFGFAASAEGTLAEGADVVFEEVPLRLRCSSCGTESTVQNWLFLCPSCGSVETVVRQGEDLEIIDIEVEEND